MELDDCPQKSLVKVLLNIDSIINEVVTNTL